jgi:hypothetical protein
VTFSEILGEKHTINSYFIGNTLYLNPVISSHLNIIGLMGVKSFGMDDVVNYVKSVYLLPKL